MANQAHVRKIALELPGTEERAGRFAFAVIVRDKPKDYAWVWLERVAPRMARVANPSVLALRVSNLSEKELKLKSNPEKFFTEPHYNGYPAVLLRLSKVRMPELRALLHEAWQCTVAKAAKPSSVAPSRGATHGKGLG